MDLGKLSDTPWGLQGGSKRFPDRLIFTHHSCHSNQAGKQVGDVDTSTCNEPQIGMKWENQDQGELRGLPFTKPIGRVVAFGLSPTRDIPATSGPQRRPHRVDLMLKRPHRLSPTRRPRRALVLILDNRQLLHSDSHHRCWFLEFAYGTSPGMMSRHGVGRWNIDPTKILIW